MQKTIQPNPVLPKLKEVTLDSLAAAGHTMMAGLHLGAYVAKGLLFRLSIKDMPREDMPFAAFPSEAEVSEAKRESLSHSKGRMKAHWRLAGRSLKRIVNH